MPRSAALTALVLTACLHVHVKPPPAAGGPSARAAEGLAPGDRVVGRRGDGLLEGTVLDVDGKLVTLAWDDAPGERAFAPRGFLVELGEAPAAVAEGDLLLCAWPPYWAPCRVKKAPDGSGPVTVQFAGGTSADVARGDLLPLPADLDRWAETVLAVAPVAPVREGELVPVTAGNPVVVGQIVLARWEDASWWEARVVSFDGVSVVAAWADGSGPSTLPAGDVAPVPVAPGILPPGAVAYCRWQNDTRWWRARIDAVQGGAMDIVYEDGGASRVGPQDCVAALMR